MTIAAVATSRQPVLILGAGIHGTALARELLLNGLDVVLADSRDLAAGATSKSSRLIHGGLRYLEYGDVHLVRESLEERRRNLDLAANFVQPLRLYIPLRESWSGLVSSAAGFLGGKRSFLGGWLSYAGKSANRGFWPVRFGLSMYDWLARDSTLPASAAVRLDDPAAPQVSRSRYRSMLAYTDARMQYPERAVLALLADAEAIAKSAGCGFELLTYVRLEKSADQLELTASGRTLRISPSLIVNVSGAAGDETLQTLGIAHPGLFAGTKGSHLLTWNPELRQALKGQAVYAEAADGRPVFTLPFGDGVLIGTTDEPYSGDPAEATASEAEVSYLLQMVQDVFGIELTTSDIVATYSGVRPLPRAETDSAAAISRDHSLVWKDAGSTPVLTLVGGKLTTWRAVAEELADHVLGKLGCLRQAHTRERPLPGGASPVEQAGQHTVALQDWWQNCALQTESSLEEVRSLWPLFGTRVVDVLEAVREEPRETIADTAITARVVRWIIRHEQVTHLEDLIERRLLTVFQPQLSRRQVSDLARCMIDCERLRPGKLDAAIGRAVQRLQHYYGRRFD